MTKRAYRLSCAVGAAALLLPVGAASAPKEPLRLQPVSKWNVHYADDSCRMSRVFGEGDQQVAFIAERYRPSDALRISFIGKPAGTSLNQGVVRILFGPSETEQEVEFYPATAADKQPALILRGNVRVVARSPQEMAAYEAALKAGEFQFRWSEITPEQEEAITFISVRRSIREHFILETGPLGGPLAALRTCTNELLTHWGIDVARHAGSTRPVTPKSDPRNWVTPGDYPSSMLAMGKRAIVQFRLNVDAAGAPTACHIQQSTRPKQFDDAVCAAIMRRAKFEPALDADGRPMPSYWLNSVTFHI